MTSWDLMHCFVDLGVRKSERECRSIIWEVDENLDGCVDWDEFQMMYYRNMTDTTGLEPFELFNIVQARIPLPLFPPPEEDQPL